MAKTPIVRPVSVFNASITLAVLAIFVAIGWWIGKFEGAAIGALIYLAISFTLRRTLTKNHQQGVKYCKEKNFESAIPEFESSYDFFDKHQWIDDYQAITLLSAAEMKYREMALVSLGFCYSQLGNAKQSRHYYEKCIQMFPDNGMAEAALNFLNAAEKSD